MLMHTEVLKIIEGGLDKNRDKVQSYALLLSNKLRSEGEENLAARIENLINKKTVHPVYLDEFMSKPIDKDSRLEMVDVFYSETHQDEIILSGIIKVKVDNFVDSLKHRNKFLALGINSPESLLLFGPPGCGKTSIAKYISAQTGLPLITARLDGLVSSLLGNTAKNIRNIFQYAKERPCILFLDEFDAIAKARNDDNEVGELKRVVNSLLQNIDDFNENNILIAATNHEKLLDPAIWRRFTTVIEVPKPSESEISELIRLFLNSVDYDFKDDAKKLKKLTNSLQGLSPAEIKTICYNTIKLSIIKEMKLVTYPLFLYQVYLFRGYNEQDIPIALFLNEHGVIQSDISKVLGISIRQVRKYTNNEVDKNEG
ncbi:AAA family ATPase [Desulfotomaculum sp. 1211_IL3151]|uniref:AAA family ATPase n=1 Tax=Desulfotomaculum sp. 1211_IL3151 TaxID=3084055 RepID=UPI002FD97096